MLHYLSRRHLHHHRHPNNDPEFDRRFITVYLKCVCGIAAWYGFLWVVFSYAEALHARSHW